MLLIDDLHVRVSGRDTGQLIRELILNPTRDYQPRGLPQAQRPAPYAAHQQLPLITAQQQRPQPESRLAAGHPQGPGLDPGENAATLTDPGQQQ
jgi:hypothetical protein